MTDVHAAAQAILAAANARVNTPAELAATVDDNLDDPAKQHPNPVQDPGWQRDAQGVWHNPHYPETA